MQKDFSSRYSLDTPSLKMRYDKTMKFLIESVPAHSNVLDLGIENLFSELMKEEGFSVTNTQKNVDLDLEFEIVKNPEFDVVTAFEIFEHMVAPFNLLREISAKYLVASVPLKLWFANAYWNDDDPWDRHYHEFEPKQFDMLLEKSGWKINNSQKWVSKTGAIGVRPILRNFFPRYYIVFCERKNL